MSLPPEHLAQLQQSLGKEFDAFLAAYTEAAPVSVRVNTLKPYVTPSQERIPWNDSGFYLAQRPSFTHDPLFHAGCYYVQEASSQFLAHVAKTVFPKDEAIKVLDLCAAPGGKSTLLASELNDDSLLVSNEVIRSRAHILAENISKWGKPNVVVSNNDPEQFGKLNGFFDVIVVDAPCSGEGLFRRDPELTVEWSPENVNLCSARQRRIVLDIWPALKEGGLLVYSTCTFNAQENEENLQWLATQIGCEGVAVPVPAEWNIVESVVTSGESFTSSVVENTGPSAESSSLADFPTPLEVTNSLPSPVSRLPSYRFYPHRVKGEGFFIAVLRKTEAQTSSSHKEKTLFPPAPSKEKNEVAPWLKEPSRFDFIRRGDHVLAIPKQHTDAVHRLSRTLNCVQYGIPVADAQKGLKPLHELALSVHLNKDAFHQTELTKEEALKFLAKEDFKVNSAHKGISLMTFEGVPLGWMNLLGNRANNLYPKEWRIRRL